MSSSTRFPVTIFSDLKGLPLVPEMRGMKMMKTQYGEVQINAIADAVVGNLGYEWKTTSKSIQLDKYIEAPQWKACCWVFGLPAMEYRILQMAKDRKTGVFSVKKSEAIQMIYSPYHFTELQFLVNTFIDFCLSQGLEDYIKPNRFMEAI